MRRAGVGTTVAALVCTLAACASAADMMSVQVRRSAVRTAPSYLAKVAGTVSYCDRVTVVEKKSGWIKVSTPAGVNGWMNASALTRKRLVLKAGKGAVSTGASSEELALAGKGFNSDVEARFKAEHGDANFTAVDRMEKRSASNTEVVAFLREGDIKGNEKTGGDR